MTGYTTIDAPQSLRDAPSILVVWDAGQLRVPLLEKRSWTLGRDAGCEFVVNDASVSRRHLRIVLGEEIEVEDLGSSNGTQVDGRKIEAGTRARLGKGSVVSFGAALLFVESPKAPRPEARPEHLEPKTGPLAATLDRARRLADGELSVFVHGETGVGKEFVAESIHLASPRNKRPYLRVSCAAMPRELMEAELFGHEAGAFTGARHARPGLLEVASGGTLFLDELGELPLELQAKLLRAVESKESTRLGGHRSRMVDVRFVVASNRDLGALVAKGEFRADLYYRIAGAVVTVPPLRERIDEILPLAEFFLKNLAARRGKPRYSLSKEAADLLENYSFPGNVRELKSIIEQAAALARGTDIGIEDLVLRPLPFSSSPSQRPPVSPDSPQADAAERFRVEGALERAAGNQTRAARELGISRSTLIRRLDELGISRPRK